MARRVAATGCSGRGGGGVRALFSSFSLNPPPNSQTPTPPKPDPSTILFVSGLSKRTTSEGLRDVFAHFGEVLQARVATDRVSGFSKCFGFVRYVTIKEAEAGIKGMDGQYLDGWAISAEFSRPRQPPPPLQNNYTSPYSRQ